MDDVHLYGTDSRGKVISPESGTIRALDDILQPHNMTSQDFSWPVPGEIEVLFGREYAKYSTSNPPQEYQKITRPENLRFKSSPVYPRPIMTGVLQGNLISYPPGNLGNVGSQVTAGTPNLAQRGTSATPTSNQYLPLHGREVKNLPCG